MEDLFYCNVIKYLEGRMDELEKISFLEEIKKDPNKEKIYSEIKSVWHATALSDYNTEKAYDQFLLKKDQAFSTKAKVQNLFSKITYLKVASIAALFIVGIGLGIIMTRSINSPITTKSFCSISVPFGHEAVTILPDGTEVKIRSGSTLKYPSKFSDKDRCIFFEGEAFFHVTKDPRHPFIINSNNIQVTVKGTSFNMWNYSEDSLCNIALIEGNVNAKYDNNKEININPGIELSYNKRNKIIKQKKILPKETLAWQQGYLYFSKDPLIEVTKKIKYRYGVTIDLDTSISQDITFSGILRNGENALQIIKAIQATTKNLHYNMISENHYKLYQI